MSYKRMILHERMEIFKGLYHQKMNATQIAIKLNRSVSTITREIQRGMDEGDYNPILAECNHLEQRSYQRPNLKIDKNLWLAIKEKLELRWSPHQVSEFLLESQAKQVSSKTIYNYINFHMKGELKKVALKDLRLKGKKRKKPGITECRGKLKNMTLIDKRPKEINSREPPVHWEGDLIIGKNHKSALCVIVERKTRYVQIDLLEKYDAGSVRQKIEKRFKSLEPKLRQSLTLDQGKENSQHEIMTKRLNLDEYFCHPASPWEKGACVNTNYLIRDMIGEENDFRKFNQRFFSTIARKLNQRSRQTLGFKTPLEVFNKLR